MRSTRMRLRTIAPFLVPAVIVAACSGSGGSSSSSSSGGGTHPSSSGTGGAPSTTSASGGDTASSSGGGAGGSDAGPSDAGDLDAADLGDALGKGGLPLGAMCGANATGDGGTKCGSGLACCAPCPISQSCGTKCVVACSPHQQDCIDGCMPQL